MYDGILFCTPEFRSETPGDEKRYKFAIAVGYLTKDPIIQHHSKTKVMLNLKYHTKSFLNVVMWGDTEASLAARSLEKGDTVLCIGTITYSTYIVQKGEQKGMKREWHELNANLVLAQSWLNCVIEMYLARGIQDILQAEKSDAMESLDGNKKEQGNTIYAPASSTGNYGYQ